MIPARTEAVVLDRCAGGLAWLLADDTEPANDTGPRRREPFHEMFDEMVDWAEAEVARIILGSGATRA